VRGDDRRWRERGPHAGDRGAACGPRDPPDERGDRRGPERRGRDRGRTDRRDDGRGLSPAPGLDREDRPTVRGPRRRRRRRTRWAPGGRLEGTLPVLPDPRPDSGRRDGGHLQGGGWGVRCPAGRAAGGWVVVVA